MHDQILQENYMRYELKEMLAELKMNIKSCISYFVA
jgi:hypothetical protein